MRETQRLDKWLWHARIVKTRSLAAQMVSQGRFRVNRTRVVKPAFTVKAGDVLTTAIHGRVRVLQLTGISARRGPVAEARQLYIDLTPEEPEAGQTGQAGRAPRSSERSMS